MFNSVGLFYFSLQFYCGASEGLKNDFGKLPNGSWVYLNNNGDAVTGEQTIRGKKMCFMSDGIQVKGKSALGNDGKYHYYDANSGIRLS